MKEAIYFGKGQKQVGARLPVPERTADLDPRLYIADAALVDAANTAIALGMPLLLTGEPGTGKTRFASSLAYELDLAGPFVFQAKSNSEARDLFYAFDALGALRAAQAGDRSLPNSHFITLNALGRAIVTAQAIDARPPVFGATVADPVPRRAVVLIDEIDKAPRDFPNDILAEFEELSFRIPEMNGVEIRAAAHERPIVIVTSNSEKQLPDAFLRRCIYYHIPFPDRDRLSEILHLRFMAKSPSPELAKALDIFLALRAAPGISKPPATAELLDFCRALARFGPDLGAEIVERAFPALLKTADDREIARREVRRYFEGS